MAGARDGDQRAVGQRNAHAFALAAVAVHGVEATRDACRGDAVPAMRAGPVAVCEGRDDEVTLLDVADFAAHPLDDADELVADRAGLEGRVAAVVPEVRAADAGQDDSHDGVRRLAD